MVGTISATPVTVWLNNTQYCWDLDKEQTVALHANLAFANAWSTLQYHSTSEVQRDLVLRQRCPQRHLYG